MPSAIDPNKALSDVEFMIRDAVARRLRGKFRVHRLDVAQEVRLHLWQRVIPKFDPSRGLLTTFCFIPIRNCVEDHARRLERVPVNEPLATEPLDDGGDLDLSEAAKEIIAELPTAAARHLEFVLACDSASEIADVLGLPIARIHERTSRLCREIRELTAA